MSDQGTPPAPPADAGTPPAPPQRPEFVPEAHWDADKGAIKDTFGAHYNELATFHKTESERQAALKARKPEDIKLEVKLPDDVKVPAGLELKINDKDPRVAPLRAIATEFGLPQEAVSKLIEMDARHRIEAHNAELTRVAEETKKLGDKASDRIAAVSNWAKGLNQKNDITAAEYEEIKLIATTAAGVTLLEKLIAKSNGVVPGSGGGTPPKEPEKPLEQKLWPKRQGLA